MADAATAIVGVLGVIMILFWLFAIAIAIGGTILWIFMLVDAAKRKFPKSDDRLIWILIIVLTGVIGAIVYYFVVKQKDKK